MFLWWKSKEVEERIFQHFNRVEATLIKGREALEAYLRGELERAEALAQEASDLESQADGVRRQVEAQLLSGALLADSRQDLWEIIERVDKLADVGEAMLYFLLLQRVEIPEKLKPLIETIYAKTLELIEALKEAIHLLFRNLEELPRYTERVEQLEHEIDTLERRAVQEIFASEMELAQKTLIRDFIMILTDISDRGEDVSDLLELAMARRRI